MTELILECCGKPESQCRCDEPKPNERLVIDKVAEHIILKICHVTWMLSAELK